MRIAVTGSTGFIGRHLCAHLRAGGHDVVPVVRGDGRGPDRSRGRPTTVVLAPDAFDDCDAVVHLAGAGVGDRRWTESYKRTIRESRIAGTTLIAATIADSRATARRCCSSSSGVDIYGDRGDAVHRRTVETAGRDSFLAAVCLDWEAATAPAADAGMRVVNMRTGMVLGRDGGALAKQLPLFRLGLGGQFGGGTQWQSWISIVDDVRAIEHLLTSTLQRPGEPHGADAGDQRRVHQDARRGAQPAGDAPDPALRTCAAATAASSPTRCSTTGQRVVPAALLADGFDVRPPDARARPARAVLDR